MSTKDHQNPTPSLEEHLGTEAVERMKDRMHHQPCIVCDEMHTAWNCHKTKGPIVLGAWINRLGNVPQGKGRVARDLVRVWQDETAEHDGKDGGGGGCERGMGKKEDGGG
jgi:hypothetical protein